MVTEERIVHVRSRVFRDFKWRSDKAFSHESTVNMIGMHFFLDRYMYLGLSNVHGKL